MIDNFSDIDIPAFRERLKQLHDKIKDFSPEDKLFFSEFRRESYDDKIISSWGLPYVRIRLKKISLRRKILDFIYRLDMFIYLRILGRKPDKSIYSHCTIPYWVFQKPKKVSGFVLFLIDIYEEIKKLLI